MEDSAATVSHLGVQYVMYRHWQDEFCSPTRTPNRHYWSQRRWQKYFDEGNVSLLTSGIVLYKGKP